MALPWALTSGTGVAVALLQGSTGPLIGVAISASLLPPVVNCVSKFIRRNKNKNKNKIATYFICLLFCASYSHFCFRLVFCFVLI